MDVARSTVRQAAGWAAATRYAALTTRLTISPVGNLVAYISYRDLGDLSDRDLTVKCIEPGFETVHTTPVPWLTSNRPAFSPDGRLLLLDLGESYRLWDTQTWVETDIPYSHMDELNPKVFCAPQWSHDSTTCIVGYDGDGFAYVLDALALEVHRVWLPSKRFQCIGVTGHHLYTVPTPGDTVHSVNSQESIIRIGTWNWRGITKVPVQELEVQSSEARRLSFVPTQNAVLCEGIHTMRLRSLIAGELLWATDTLPIDTLRDRPVGWYLSEPNMGCGMTPNGNTIAIFHRLTHTIAFFDTTSGTNIGNTTIDAIGPEVVQDLYLINGKRVLVRYDRIPTAMIENIGLFVEEYNWE